MFCVKYGNKMIEHCPRCHAERDRRVKYSKSKTRTLEEKQWLVSSYHQNMDSYRAGNKNQVESSLAAVSIDPMQPVLHNFPFVVCVPVLDIYAIFSDEPLHTFYIAIYKLIKQCLSDRLRSSE